MPKYVQTNIKPQSEDAKLDNQQNEERQSDLKDIQDQNNNDDDQGGWEEDIELDIEFLKNVSNNSEEKIEEKKKQIPLKTLKGIEKLDKNVEKALDDFFLNDDGDFDQINPDEAQGAIKFLEIKRSTPQTTTKEPDEKEEIKIEHKSPEQILHQFVADVKTSQDTQLLTEQSITVNVLEATYFPGGIFQFAYNEYTLVTSPFGWMTKRRENDFIKLREYLCK